MLKPIVRFGCWFLFFTLLPLYPSTAVQSAAEPDRPPALQSDNLQMIAAYTLKNQIFLNLRLDIGVSRYGVFPYVLFQESF